MEILKTSNTGMKMNCWESLFKHTFQQEDILIEEQKVNDLNPIYTLANATRQPEYTT
jgi:hypothetical protein